VTALTLLLAGLLTACADDRSPSDTAAVNAYDDWIYHPDGWYDDSFWIWIDNNPDCCDDENIRESLEDWWNDLDSGEQDDIRDRLQGWLDANGLEPAEGETMREFVLGTAAERWDALIPEERQQWLSGREDRIEKRRQLTEDMTPEQRAAIEAKRESVTPEQRDAALATLEQSIAAQPNRFGDPISNHPIPGRSDISGSSRFRAGDGFGGRGGFGGGGGGGRR